MSSDLIVINDSIHLAPLRSLDQFIFNSARFEMPTYTDLKKWNNRIVTNLLYYQTNYFAIVLILVVLSSFVHASDVTCGLSALAVLGAVGLAAVSRSAQVLNFRKEYPYVALALICAAGYYFIYMLPSVIVVLFTTLVPVFVVLIHASFRLRNFSSKWNHQVEKMELRRTPMSLLLDLLNVEFKNA